MVEKLGGEELDGNLHLMKGKSKYLVICSVLMEASWHFYNLGNLTVQFDR